ncbi:putative sodium-dependent multivitamin transporter [Trichonephila inaurata madagascariensis]|uniref:Putative sodium-dependent multivitamin transporter n=1 Tax=Trichonephila inaurata madagascariensis TaxID=2747483 RepID=A0A8X7BX32_9ARAC|nr:putative sodium-dependent multivitamin transporter [Trichonephila inaurata madagascariensis]
MDFEDNYLHPIDYGVILITLCISACIGLYFRFVGGKQKTKEEYLQAGRNMGILPVAFSLMATYMSATTLMGIPAEMYLHGTHMVFLNIGFILGMLTGAFVFLPVYFNAQVSTSYEYLERRFGILARTVCSLGFAIQAILYMAVVLYTPSLALSAVTNLSTWTCVISVGLICTFYCTLGGMKAVLWTDVFQAFLMFTCLFAIIVNGAVNQGGLDKIFHLAKEGERLILPSFAPDVTLRYTMWNILLQGFAMATFSYGTSQLQVQRLLSVKKASQAQISIVASIPLTVGFHLLCCLCGLIFVAEFYNCDPLHSHSKTITSADQLMPYYIMTFFKEFPGLPGLCICGIFAASLSTISSFIQTLTVVTVEDFILPFYKNCNFTQTKVMICAKAITLLYGLLGILLSLVVASFGSIIEATITLFSALGGPLLGLFFLAVFTTETNEKGAVLGMMTSFMLAVWLSLGPFSSTIDVLPFSTTGCSSQNDSISVNDTTALINIVDFYQNITSHDMNVTSSDINNAESNFQLSYMWITPIAFVTSMILGYFFSLIFKYTTGEQKYTSPENLSPVLLWFEKTISRTKLPRETPKEEIRMRTIEDN